MSGKFFGTDGIRGRVGDEPIAPETMLKLGWAAGRVFGAANGTPGKVIIGKDTRVSGYLLESALEAGLCAAGVDISLLGPMPTPGIAYLTRTARARAGIVISASHNQYEDNGIKFFSTEGAKLADVVEQQIEAMMEQPMRTVESAALGKAERFPDAAGRYIEFCKSTIPHRLSLKGLKIVVDCAHGAAYHVAPDVFAELGATVTAIGDAPNGFNINSECGSTYPQFVRGKVLELGADVGIALDGDGDRVILVDAAGHYVDGDQILYILARWRKQTGQPGDGIVGTLMSNLGLERACSDYGISFKRARVGDRHVMECLVQHGWLLGGESSGHIICLDKSTTGDGIIAALEVLHVMIAQNRTLAELTDGMDVYPQTMINVRLDGADSSRRAINVDHSETVQDALRTVRSELAEHGRVVLRPSGTEPVVRVMVEGNDVDQIARLGQFLADAVETAACTTSV